MSALGNLLIPTVLVCAIGVIAQTVKAERRVLPDKSRLLSTYLLVAIGLYGGFALGKAELVSLSDSLIWAVVPGLALPLITYFTLQDPQACRQRARRVAVRY